MVMEPNENDTSVEAIEEKIILLFVNRTLRQPTLEERFIITFLATILLKIQRINTSIDNIAMATKAMATLLELTSRPKSK